MVSGEVIPWQVYGCDSLVYVVKLGEIVAYVVAEAYAESCFASDDLCELSAEIFDLFFVRCLDVSK